MKYEIELGWSTFMDTMVSRCETKEKAYEKLSDFVKYLQYTEVRAFDLSNAFVKLFEKEYLNAVVEGKHTTFTNLYKELANGKKPSLPKDDSYSGYGIKVDDVNPGQLYHIKSAISLVAASSRSGCGSRSSRCGSSNSGCGSSHSSPTRCGSSSSPRSSSGSSRCVSSSSSGRCGGSSPSRC